MIPNASPPDQVARQRDHGKYRTRRLIAPAWGYIDHLAGTRGGLFAALADTGRRLTITPAMVDAVAATTAGIVLRVGTRTTCGLCTIT